MVIFLEVTEKCIKTGIHPRQLKFTLCHSVQDCVAMSETAEYLLHKIMGTVTFWEGENGSLELGRMGKQDEKA